MAKRKIDKENELLNEQIKQRQELANLERQELNSLNNIFNTKKNLLNTEGQIRNTKETILDLEIAINNALKKGVKAEDSTLKSLNEKLAKQRALLTASQKQLDIDKKKISVLGTISKYNGMIWKYLMEADSAIKTSTRELGLSGERSEIFKDNIYEASGYAARLGANIKDLTSVTTLYADETGRATLLNEQSLKNIIAIGKGTAIGVDQASRLAGQFELMGMNAQATIDYVQGVVDTSERMGVNTTKVLKNISNNFKALQKFTFRDGVQGFAKMAGYAEKFKVDMGSMLDSAEKARTLEGAVELGAQLQVMGGEFAKSDPFELLFLSRNDPAKYTEKINEMTKGIATFRKNADGTFETFISPMDIDRLNRVGEALGMQRGELAEQARRMAEIQKSRQQMLGLGFSKEEKELVEGVARLNSETGRMMVKIGTISKDVSNLTKNELETLKTQTVSLEKRAMNAQTFDEAFQATIMELKTALLPLLDVVNTGLQAVRPYVIQFNEWFSSLNNWVKGGIAVAGSLLLAGGALTKAFSLIKNISVGGLFGGKKAVGKVTGKGGGLGGLAAGAGAGLAGVGIGGGIMLAAKGFSDLADSINKLPVEKLEYFKDITTSLTIAIPVAVAVMGGMALAAKPLALGLGIVSASALALGYSLKMGGEGIMNMTTGMANLLSVADPKKIGLTAAAMGGLGVAATVLANPLSLAGIAGLTASVLAMSSAGDGMEKVGNAFKNIGVVLQGSTNQLSEIERTIKSITSAEISNNSILANLNKLLSKPLQVEFADKDVAFNANISLNLDSAVLMDKLSLKKDLTTQIKNYVEGKS